MAGKLCVLSFALALSLPAYAVDAGPDAGEIARLAYEVHGGNDAFSRLHFTFEAQGARTTRLTVVMGFKRGGGADYRVIMFNEHPPDTRDVAFLGSFHPPESRQEPEMWLYLPELRQSRRLTAHRPGGHGDHGHHGHGPAGDVADEFSTSELNHEELMPRWPGLDTHRLLGKERLDGAEADTWMIESVPRDPLSSDYARRVQWIDAERSLPMRIDYYDGRAQLVKTQTFTWLRVGEAWVWDRVAAVNHLSGARTLLEQTDVRVDLGLPDNLFTRRALGLGARAFASRAGR